MSKQADILNRLKSSKKTGAQTFIEAMNQQVTETEPESKHEPITENKSVPELEQHTEQETELIHEHNNEQFTEPTHEPNTEPVIEYKTILEKFSDKKTKEDLFTRQTYLIRNDLIERFDKAAKTRRKGFKTEVINELLENFLNENGL